MCFRDMTFCKFEDCGKWNDCHWAFTAEIKKAAGDWWERGGGKAEDAPVCFYVDCPICYKDKP